MSLTIHPEMRRNLRLLGAAALGLSVGMLSGLFYSMGTLMPAWEAEFGWSRGDMSLSLTFATLAMFVCGTFGGRLGDRYGAARVGASSLLTYGLLFALFPYVLSDVTHLWIGYVVLAIIGVPSTAIIMIRPITSAFDARRGLAMGIAMTGAGVAGFWIPQYVAYIIEIRDWRTAMSALGALACLAAPLIWLGFRNQDAVHRAADRSAEQGVEFAVAVRTLRFWILSIMAIAMSLGVGGLVVHFVPLFTDLGAETLRAAQIASLLGLASVAGRIAVGMLLDRYPAQFVTTATLLMAAAGAMLLYSFGLTLAPLSVMMLGLAAGAEVDLIAYLCSRHFGTRAYGAIYGWQYSIFVLGYGLSPFLVGLSRDAFGNYDSALIGSMLAVGTAGLLAIFLKLPKPAPVAVALTNEISAQSRYTG
ncbi:MFS transporter [Tsuneonella sp. YG55]|uniref:MFS transporter n=1 Tax=Tsuneonella litorea TaxID=2976475 RepID=A0A9X2VZP5_9SPHN|nr:MFS transporter [Tsuneonella litorea]MCT2557529.1 MFS transporter [Tsuneonella litorea]